MSNGAQVMYMVTVVLIGLAMGTTILTARAVGAKDNDRARNIVGNTITMFAITSIRRHRGVMDISRSDLQSRRDVIKNIL